jgi:hypothetical protein
MSQCDLNMFTGAINRILMLFVYWFKWVKSLVCDKQNIDSKSVSLFIHPNEKYIEPLKLKFLQTFREDDYDCKDWNSNIEESIKDKELLQELLKNPKNELEKKWQTRILIENTPRGNVIMFYDLYKQAFSYYCDQARMPYELMNAVAMKYVMTFHCRDFFVDSSILPVKLSSAPVDEKREDDVNKTVKYDKNAFAKFKNYNNATKKVGISPENDKVINCFLHLGSSRNWSPVPKKVKQNPLNGFKTDLIPGSNNNNKMSYLDYKNKMKKDQ